MAYINETGGQIGRVQGAREPQRAVLDIDSAAAPLVPQDSLRRLGRRDRDEARVVEQELFSSPVFPSGIETDVTHGRQTFEQFLAQIRREAREDNDHETLRFAESHVAWRLRDLDRTSGPSEREWIEFELDTQYWRGPIADFDGLETLNNSSSDIIAHRKAIEAGEEPDAEGRRHIDRGLGGESTIPGHHFDLDPVELSEISEIGRLARIETGESSLRRTQDFVELPGGQVKPRPNRTNQPYYTGNIRHEAEGSVARKLQTERVIAGDFLAEVTDLEVPVPKVRHLQPRISSKDRA